MACTLVESAKPGVDFEGPSGESFKITIVPEPGSTLVQVSAVYGGQSDLGSQADLKVISGLESLVITYAAAKLGERGSLTELCSGGGQNTLRGIRSTQIFTRQYVIEGK